jgi:CO/xanthine dehydrogenase Mo-binding subunit
LCPDDGGTAGSRTTPATVPSVRAAAVAARAALSNLAAARLGLDPAAIQYDAGEFTEPNGGKITLAELAADDSLCMALDVTPSRDVSITRVADWRVLGQSTPKTTGRDVVTGAHKYASDLVREGMLYGKVLRPPSFSAMLAEIDLAPAEAMGGVVAVRDGDFVGCAAPTSWQAQQAVDALAATAKWTETEHISSDQLFEHLKQSATTEGGGWDGPRENTWGDGVEAVGSAVKSYSGDFTIAYIQHAPMEPRAAVAEWAEGKLTVWTGSQQPARVRGELAEAFRLNQDQVRVIVPDTGGGFGGKHTGEAAVEAARIAKAAGKPVSLRWTREEEFTWAYFRPAGLIEVRAGLDETGKLITWDFTNYNSGGSALDSPYDSLHGRTRFVPTESPLRQGSYRALASTANVFARESAIDELANLASENPLEFRLNHLPKGRLSDVLVAAAERFKWGERWANPGDNKGVGLACGTEKGSFVAACAEVEVVNGQMKVLSICQAFECGAIQNPRNLRSQVEGCLIMGLGALFEHTDFADGKITNPTFSAYRVPRMVDMPRLEIELLDRPDLASLGAGETPIIAVAPAIANALFHAAGIRSRSLPFQTIVVTS